MTVRLLVHAHVPHCGASRLNRALFFRSYSRGETLLAYDEAFCRQARMGGAAPARALATARLALGHVPYGYFDGLGRWPLYVSVFDDPVNRFLSRLGEVMAMPGEERAALLPEGADADALAGDPEALAQALLSGPAERKLLLNAMTRMAAGMPALVPVRLDRADLAVAKANLSRANYLVALREDLPNFQGYLRDVLGIGVGQQRAAGTEGWPQVLGGAQLRRPVKLRPGDVSARTISRIEAANDLDMHLHEAAAMAAHAAWG
ncbi:hypothetical protein ACQ5SO_15780 [Rhodovulum sp. DZ06]|uniref:hypothetical protein n=1 Tax=Rhodovulum sp. DZ06 TaxID=3425126 RepID=UPI003D3570DE